MTGAEFVSLSRIHLVIIKRYRFIISRGVLNGWDLRTAFQIAVKSESLRAARTHSSGIRANARELSARSIVDRAGRLKVDLISRISESKSGPAIYRRVIHGSLAEPARVSRRELRVRVIQMRFAPACYGARVLRVKLMARFRFE
jgi:hypothetical protein